MEPFVKNDNAQSHASAPLYVQIKLLTVNVLSTSMATIKSTCFLAWKLHHSTLKNAAQTIHTGQTTSLLGRYPKKTTLTKSSQNANQRITCFQYGTLLEQTMVEQCTSFLEHCDRQLKISKAIGGVLGACCHTGVQLRVGTCCRYGKRRRSCMAVSRNIDCTHMSVCAECTQLQ